MLPEGQQGATVWRAAHEFRSVLLPGKRQAACEFEDQEDGDDDEDESEDEDDFEVSILHSAICNLHSAFHTG